MNASPCYSRDPRSGSGRGAMRALLALTASAACCHAAVMQTMPTPGDSSSLLAATTIGGGAEFERTSDSDIWEFPLRLEFNVSDRLKLSAEPRFVSSTARTPEGTSAVGLGDFEIGAAFEFVRERRYLPALTTVAIIRWPTTSDPDLGNPGSDYTLGLIASKDLSVIDVDVGASYSVVGDKKKGDQVELSLKLEYPLTYNLTLEAELIHTLYVRPAADQPARRTEGVLGLGWEFSRRLKMEIGVGMNNDGDWRGLLGWTYGL